MEKSWYLIIPQFMVIHKGQGAMLKKVMCLNATVGIQL